MTELPDAYAMSAQWWNERKSAYPFQAETPVTIDPSRIDLHYQHHASCVMRPGIRTWGFQSPIDRDAFVVQYGATKI